MKKILYSALALPLLFACSSEDFDNQAINNDPFAGIQKVDATFSMDEDATTRMDKGSWDPQEGDLWGFAWLTDAYEDIDDPVIELNGKAYQNHNLIQTSGIFKPQTSIYVGKYYLYRPYDATTVSPQAVNFNSLIEQPMTEGYLSTTDAWKALAKTAINIGDKWTEVTPEGQEDEDVEGKYWNKAGIGHHYDIYGAFFSNQTGLDLTYDNNNVDFGGEKIVGATDIDYTYPANSTVGAAKIYGATVQLAGAANSFTYAPQAEPNEDDHDGKFWASKKGLGENDGFFFPQDAAPIALNPGKDGISTGAEGSKAWFWFNSLPVTAGTGALNTNVTATFATSYGTVTVEKTIAQCASVFDQPHEGAEGYENENPEWIKLNDANADDLSKGKDKKTWKFAGHKTFINEYGNHKGKYALTVDFSTGDMDGMHIVDDEHLQTALKFIIASEMNIDNTVNLLLDKDDDGEFKISKISIALLQTINAGNGNPKVLVKACDDQNANPSHTPERIVITQAGQAGVNGLDGKKDVPALAKVFAEETDVYLSKDYDWTWSKATAIPMDENVNSITIEGNLNVTSTNVEMTTDVPLINAKVANKKMTINAVTTVKNALTNYGVIDVKAGAELRAYGVAITNDATSKEDCGIINNSGVVGVTYNTNGTFNNYGLIDMKTATAITLLTSNQTEEATIDAVFSDGDEPNKLGTVKLPAGQPNALVSVSNAEETGFIEYTWNGGNTYSTPNNGVVKYNTLLVSDNIAFTTTENEIKYIKFSGSQKTVTNSTDENLPLLKGIIVTDNSSIIIEKNNIISCSDGSHLGANATVYNGGTFNPGNENIEDREVTDYLGTWSLDQIVVWGQQQQP